MSSWFSESGVVLNVEVIGHRDAVVAAFVDEGVAVTPAVDGEIIAQVGTEENLSVDRIDKGTTAVAGVDVHPRGGEVEPAGVGAAEDHGVAFTGLDDVRPAARGDRAGVADRDQVVPEGAWFLVGTFRTLEMMMSLVICESLMWTSSPRPGRSRRTAGCCPG